MSFCKICQHCGNVIFFPKRLSCPDNCPECGSWIRDYPMYHENDPCVENEKNKWKNKTEHTKKYITLKLSAGNEISLPPEECINCAYFFRWAEKNKLADKEQRYTENYTYILQMANGKEIEIPKGGCVIGRTETGAEELSDCLSVSRHHLRIIPRSQGLILEDLSRYGTFVNGERIQRTLVKEGAKITLGDTETILIIKGQA